MMNRKNKNKNIPSLPVSARWIWLGLWGLAMVSGGCKKRAEVTIKEDTSQLSSIMDSEHILMMTLVQGGTSSAGEELYEFVTCAVEHHSSSSTAGFSQMGIGYRVVPYQLKASWGGENYQFSLVEDSCVPTYQSQSGESFRLRRSTMSPLKVRTAVNQLEIEKAREEIESGTHYIAAFGFGAMFQGFSGKIRSAISSILPKSVAGKPFLTFVSQVGLTLPHGDHGTHIFDKIAEKNYVVVMPNRISNKPDPRPHELSSAEWVGTAASGALGYASAQVLINQASRAGPWAAIASYVVVPFVATALLHSQTHHAGDILDNFQKILAIHDPDEVGQSAAAKVTASTTSIVEVSRILGNIMLLSGWGEGFDTYCLPKQHGSQIPICKPLREQG